MADSAALQVDTDQVQPSPRRTSPRNSNNPFANRNRQGGAPTPRMKKLMKKFKKAFKGFGKKKEPVKAAAAESNNDENREVQGTNKRKGEAWELNDQAAHMRTECHSPKKRQRPDAEAAAAKGESKGEPMAAGKAPAAADADTVMTTPVRKKKPTAAAASEPQSVTPEPAAKQESKAPAAAEDPADEAAEEAAKAAYEASVLSRAFGDVVVANLENEAWAERKTGLQGVLARVELLAEAAEEAAAGDAAEAGTEAAEAEAAAEAAEAASDRDLVLRGVCVVLQRSLAERVAPIYLFAMDIFRASLKQFGVAAPADAGAASDAGGDGDGAAEGAAAEFARHAASSVASLGLTGLTPQLLVRMNDSNKRSQREACRCMLLLARQQRWQGVRGLAPYLIREDLPLHPRLTLLRLLVPETGLRRGGALSVGPVLAVAVPALRIADDKVRKAAVGVVVAAYRVSGKRVGKHLQGLKPVMMKILQRKFAEVDAGDNAAAASSSSKGSGSSRERRRSRRPRREGSLRRLKEEGSGPARRGSGGGDGDERRMRRQRRESRRQQQQQGQREAPPRPHSVGVVDGASAMVGSESVPAPVVALPGEVGGGSGDGSGLGSGDGSGSVTVHAAGTPHLAVRGTAMQFNTLSGSGSGGLLEPLAGRSGSAPSGKGGLRFDDGMYAATTYDTYAQQQPRGGDWSDDDEQSKQALRAGSRGSNGNGGGGGMGGAPGFGANESIFNLGNGGAGLDASPIAVPAAANSPPRHRRKTRNGGNGSGDVRGSPPRQHGQQQQPQGQPRLGVLGIDGGDEDMMDMILAHDL